MRQTLCSQFDDLTIGQDMILKRTWRHLGTEHRQIIVPHKLRMDIASELHKGTNGNHFGFRRSKRQLQLRFYWPGWSKHEKFAQLQCHPCKRHKRPPNRRQGLLQPMVVGERLERLGIDLTEPHPISSKGNVFHPNAD